MRTRVLIDIDDVCANLIDYWLYLYEILSHHRLTRDDIVDWNLSKFVKPEYKNLIFKIIEDPQIYGNIKPIERSLKGYNYLKNKKDKNGNPEYDIFFATHSTVGCAGRKYEWLLENGFDVDHHNYIEIYHKELLDVDIMVDDNFDNVSKTRGVGILFDAPWNRQYDWFPRANNWDEVLIAIEGRGDL